MKIKYLNRKIEGIGLLLILFTVGYQYLNSAYTQELFWSANIKMHEKLNLIYKASILDSSDVNFSEKLQEVKDEWSPYYFDGRQERVKDYRSSANNWGIALFSLGSLLIIISKFIPIKETMHNKWS